MYKCWDFWGWFWGWLWAHCRYECHYFTVIVSFSCFSSSFSPQLITDWLSWFKSEGADSIFALVWAHRDYLDCPPGTGPWACGTLMACLHRASWGCAWSQCVCVRTSCVACEVQSRGQRWSNKSLVLFYVHVYAKESKQLSVCSGTVGSLQGTKTAFFHPLKNTIGRLIRRLSFRSFSVFLALEAKMYVRHHVFSLVSGRGSGSCN